MARSVAITGPRSIGDQAEQRLDRLFDDYLRPFAGPEAHFYLGGAIGIDTAALNWLAEHTPTTLTVVVPCTVSDQPADAADSIRRWNAHGRLASVIELAAEKLGTATYHARNRWMVNHSGFVIGFPHGPESNNGTWYTLNYAAEQGKPRLVVPL